MLHKIINFNQRKLKTMVLVLLVLVVLGLTYDFQTLMSMSSYVIKVLMQSKADNSKVHVQCGQHIFPTLPFTRRNRLSRNSVFLSRNNILKNFY